MRNMPTDVTAADGKTTFPVPAISTSDFNARLAEIAGRELTADEQKRADEMAAHAWTLRVVATELFGAELVDAHFAPGGKTMAAERTTMTGQEASELFGACVQASCVDHSYTIEGPASVSFAQAVRPWDLADLTVTVVADDLVGWGYSDFLRVTTTDGQPVVCLMATGKPPPIGELRELDQDDAITAYIECFPSGDETADGWDAFKAKAERVIDIGGPNSSEVLIFADNSAYVSWLIGVDAFYPDAHQVAEALSDDDAARYLGLL